MSFGINLPLFKTLIGKFYFLEKQSVTLGDEEARKRKVQKTILERKGPPSFTCAVEMISKTECRVHHRLDATVDAILAGKSPLFEVRHLDAEANNASKSSQSTEEDHIGDDKVIPGKSQVFAVCRKDLEVNNLARSAQPTEEDHAVEAKATIELIKLKSICDPSTVVDLTLLQDQIDLCLAVFQIQEADLLQVAAVMGLEEKIDATDDIGCADAILASSYEMKQNPWIRGVAKFHQLPVFVIKSTTMAQMVKAVRMILGMDSFSSVQKQSNRTSSDIEIEDDEPIRKPSLEEIDALEEVRLAIEYIVIPGGEPVELLPRRSEIVARQLELVKSYQLAVENSGTDSNPRLQILPQKLNKKTSKTSSSFVKYVSPKSSVAGGGGATSVVRLPFLPE
ncbi:UNVERIFIED_CONTAM: protein SEEDLING PLASTID DEVELOPMENT 1 [Sesamum radiatum]|uniref:Protein SEEDLING PLASTID DEVELOPMENT 1 n=1 Tax=Sesamum radiatum TaxID=300843 RepID=A0AAW2NCS1_SESRA